MQNKAVKFSLAAVCFLLTLLLSGCSWLRLYAGFSEALDNQDPNAAKNWALRYADDLIRCGEELLGHYPEKNLPSDAVFTVSLADDGTIELWNEPSGQFVSFECRDCADLLSKAKLKSVRVEQDRVRFSLGGRGLAPEGDYSDAYYIPSDDFTGCMGYVSGMSFTEQDDGWFARGDGDDTFFYIELAEHLYFCSAHF